ASDSDGSMVKEVGSEPFWRSRNEIETYALGGYRPLISPVCGACRGPDPSQRPTTPRHLPKSATIRRPDPDSGKDRCALAESRDGQSGRVSLRCLDLQ